MISIRRLGPEDLATICMHRYRMFAEMGSETAKLDAMCEPFAAWLKPRLDDRRYFGFVGEAEGAVVAGIGLLLLDWPPGPNHPTSDVRGYILNVYVEPEFRGRGIARTLMLHAEEEFRARGVVYEMLHASAMGKPVYDGLGWMMINEMGKAL
jgi:ribosomal protein S18 acetylase RimI-like enzyme